MNVIIKLINEMKIAYGWAFVTLWDSKNVETLAKSLTHRKVISQNKIFSFFLSCIFNPTVGYNSRFYNCHKVQINDSWLPKRHIWPKLIRWRVVILLNASLSFQLLNFLSRHSCCSFFACFLTNLILSSR